MNPRFFCRTHALTILVLGMCFLKASAQLTPFDCSNGLGYILTNTSSGGNNITSLLSINLTTGENIVIKNALLPSTVADQRFLNGVGYNKIDNYLYGYRYNTNQLVRVGSDGNIELLTMTGAVANGSYAAGDVSPNGILYLYGSNRFISVDLNSSSPDYLVATQRLAYSSTIYDFAFSPIDGKIYGVTSTSTRQLFRFDPVTNTVTILGNVAGLSGESDNAFGTAFMDNLGNLFISNNASGNIYKIEKPNLLTTGSSISATVYSSALAGKTPGDGARCSSQIILPKANNDETCIASKSTDAISINVSANDAAGSYPLVNSSVRLIDGNNQRVTSLTVAQGTFSVNITSGLVQFQPSSGFSSGTASVTYNIADNEGNLSVPATISVTICPPMPVKLISFQATPEQNTVMLSWATTEEVNAGWFVIERSRDVKTWTGIGEQDAIGESVAVTNYKFTDASPMEGINYYRIKMVDKDHSFAYSRVINTASDVKMPVTFFPNPAKDIITVGGLKGGERIEIFNQAGVRIITSYPVGATFTYDVSRLGAGILLIRVIDQSGKVMYGRIARD